MIPLHSARWPQTPSQKEAHNSVNTEIGVYLCKRWQKHRSCPVWHVMSIYSVLIFSHIHATRPLALHPSPNPVVTSLCLTTHSNPVSDLCFCLTVLIWPLAADLLGKSCCRFEQQVPTGFYISLNVWFFSDLVCSYQSVLKVWGSLQAHC